MRFPGLNENVLRGNARDISYWILGARGDLGNPTEPNAYAWHIHFDHVKPVQKKAIIRLAKQVGVLDRYGWPGFSDAQERMEKEVFRILKAVSLSEMKKNPWRTPVKNCEVKVEIVRGLYKVTIPGHGVKYLQDPHGKAVQSRAIAAAKACVKMCGVKQTKKSNGPSFDVCYTAKGPVHVPEKQFKSLPAGAHAEPLRGYGFVQAVFQGGKCVGWGVTGYVAEREISRVMSKRKANPRRRRPSKPSIIGKTVSLYTSPHGDGRPRTGVVKSAMMGYLQIVGPWGQMEVREDVLSEPWVNFTIHPEGSRHTNPAAYVLVHNGKSYDVEVISVSKARPGWVNVRDLHHGFRFSVHESMLRSKGIQEVRRKRNSDEERRRKARRGERVVDRTDPVAWLKSVVDHAENVYQEIQSAWTKGEMDPHDAQRLAKAQIPALQQAWDSVGKFSWAPKKVSDRLIQLRNGLGYYAYSSISNLYHEMNQYRAPRKQNSPLVPLALIGNPNKRPRRRRNIESRVGLFDRPDAQDQVEEGAFELRLPADRVKGTMSLAQAQKKYGKQVQIGIAAFKDFHGGAMPSEEVVIYDDGRPDVQVAWVAGRSPEVTYGGDPDHVPDGSVKSDALYVHKTDEKGRNRPTYLVGLVPRKGVNPSKPVTRDFMLIGSMRSERGWLRD